MLNITFFEYAASFVVFGIAYIVCATLTGYLQTWLFDKIGDSTAHDAGYLTLNPLMHTQFFNLMLCAFFGMPLYTSPPINVYSFKGRFKHIKVFSSYCVVVLVSSLLCLLFLTAAVSLTTLIDTTILTSACVERICCVGHWLQPLPFISMLRHLHNYSKVTSVGALLLYCLAALSLALSAISAVYAVFKYISYARIERQGYYDETNELLLLVGPLLVFYFFGGYVITILFKANILGAVKLAGILGLA